MRIVAGLQAAGLALALIGTARAQPAPPAQGTLLSAEAGDIACYLRIRDAKGQAQNWMAEFELCETASRLTGRVVTLSWKAAQVQHPSCQGDTECRRSQGVMLITRMEALPR